MSSNEDDTSRNQPGAGWSNGDLHPQLYASTRTGKLQLYDKHRRWIGLSQGWTRISKGTSEQDAKHSSSHTTGTRLVTTEEEESKSVKCLIAQLCERFYHLGWATGTGGGVSIRVGGPSQNRPWKVFVAPSGIQKEDMIGDDVFTLDMNRNIIEAPKTPNLKQSACTPLWYVVYKHRPTATCVIHTHSMYAQLVTLLDYPKETKNVLRLTHLEMLKGVGNHAYDDVLEIPIIDNRPSEDLLASQLEKAIQQYPYCNAVLVRRHGVYVWGDSWEQAKTQCESFDYLFHTAIQMKQMGVDCSALPQGGTYRPTQDETKTTTTSVEPLTKKIKLTEENGFNGVAAVSNQDDVQSNVVPLLPRDKAILLLDIEGCTTSIAFVKEVLFPYVLETIEFFIDDHYPLAKRATSSEYQQLCQALQKDVQEHADKKGDASLPDPKDAVAMVQWLVQRDVKAAGLKSLQGRMWNRGYSTGELKGHVYADFVPMLQWMQDKKVPVYIYSSGSVQAQKLLFGHSIAGDLCPYLKGYFDITTAGRKNQATSYQTIAQALAVQDPSQIVFVSDADYELVAAKEAGLSTVMSIRPGNAVLTRVGKSFPAIHSLLQLCGE